MPFSIFGGQRSLATASRTCLRCIVGPSLIIAQLTAPVGAEQTVFALPAAADGLDRWLCRAELDMSYSWQMRCDSLSDILASDPVLDDEERAQPTRFIPLYGAPFANSDLSTLAAAVLCHEPSNCSIVVANR